MCDELYKPVITYFFRNHKSGYSIYKVFSSIIDTANDKVAIMPKYKADVFSVLSNLIFGFKHRDKTVAGINHVTGDVHYIILALIGCKTVLTIHDLVSLTRASNVFKRTILKWLWFTLPIKFATKITCVSTFTKKQLLDNFKIDKDKICVIYDPIDDIFKYVPKNFNRQKPTILHIGTGWNKNLSAVIEAVKDIECRLVIIGKLNAEQRHALDDNEICYENLFDLTDSQIYEEYCKCDIVSFPSIYEGFGMPIIEGMATGRVVVTSDIEPMTEIANDAACLVDPHSIESIKSGFIKVITDDTYRNNLINAGLVNVRRFQCDNIRAQYNKVYTSLL